MNFCLNRKLRLQTEATCRNRTRRHAPTTYVGSDRRCSSSRASAKNTPEPPIPPSNGGMPTTNRTATCCQPDPGVVCTATAIGSRSRCKAPLSSGSPNKRKLSLRPHRFLLCRSQAKNQGEIPIHKTLKLPSRGCNQCIDLLENSEIDPIVLVVR